MPTDRQLEWERAMERAWEVDADASFSLLRAENRILQRNLARARRAGWAYMLVGAVIGAGVMWLALW